MALPVLLLGVLLVDPALAPAPRGVEVPPALLPTPAPDAGLLALLAPASPPPSPPGVVPVPVALPAPGVEPALAFVPESVLALEDPGEVPPIPPTELEVPDALAPSLRLSAPMVGVPGAPVPAPGAVDPAGEPMGGV